MSFHILRSGHDLVIYGPLRIWAERGLIHIEDARDNSFETISVNDCLLRINGLSEMIGNSRRGGGPKSKDSFTKYMDEIEDLQRAIDQLVDTCRKAREQGMPDDPTAQGALKRARPVSVSMPKEYNMPL